MRWIRTGILSILTYGEMVCFLGSQPCIYPKRAGLIASQFWVSFLLLHNTLWRRTTKFDVVTHTWEVAYFRYQPRPASRGPGPSAPQFWFFSSYAYKKTKFDVVTCGEVRVSWGQPCRPSQESRCLTQDVQIRHNQHGKGRVLGGQPRHGVCTNASRGLSATAGYLLLDLVMWTEDWLQWYSHCQVYYINN